MADQFRVRASGAGDIMTSPRSKSETLSETCKNYVRRQWIMDKFQREKEVTGKFLEKGLMVEESGITLLSKATGEFYVKNEQWFNDNHLTGTPDVLTDTTVFDIKASWDIFTFQKAEVTEQYRWQLLCYMALAGLREASLAYVLIDTPEPLITNEVRRVCYQLQNDDEAMAIENEVRRQWTYSDIPERSRIKIMPVEWDEVAVDMLRKRVEECREFYKTIRL